MAMSLGNRSGRRAIGACRAVDMRRAPDVLVSSPAVGPAALSIVEWVAAPRGFRFPFPQEVAA